MPPGRKKRKSRTFDAHLIQVLTYYAGPQVVLLEGLAGTKIIATAVNIDGYQYPMFGAQVSDEQFSDYLQERFDLRYLLLKPSSRRHFVFDLGDVGADRVARVARYQFDEERDERLLPEAGLFARDHTEEVEFDLGSPALTIETFGIDGKWDLPEFSRFYAQVNDLYAVFNSIDVFVDEQASIDHKNRISSAFTKPFEGGGSYVSLYDSLASAHSRSNRLRMESVTYNSPGHVKVGGRAKPLAEVRELINQLDRNSHELAAEYRGLYDYLRRSKLLKMAATRFVSQGDVSAEIKTRTKRLSTLMDAVAYDDILRLAGGNVLVAAKVILSMYRRASRLHEFFLEGRAAYDKPTSAA